MKLSQPDEAVIKATVMEEEMVTTSEEESWLWKWELVSGVSGWHKKKQLLWAITHCARWWKAKQETMQMQTQMQVRRKEREEDSVGAAREEQMARTAQHGKVNPDRSSSKAFHERKKRNDSKRDQNP